VTGFIKWLDRQQGVGKIRPTSGGADILFALRGDASLRVGQRVTFKIQPGRKAGRNEATEIRAA
jgi:cold shock CspA family protein